MRERDERSREAETERMRISNREAEGSHGQKVNGGYWRTLHQDLGTSASNSLHKPFLHVFAIYFPNKPRIWERTVIIIPVLKMRK